MKENNFMILFVLFWGILIGAVVYDTISSLKHKTDAREESPVKSVYDSRFHGFEWKGHKYLKYGGSINPPVLHDPDCTCWTNRLEAVK